MSKYKHDHIRIENTGWPNGDKMSCRHCGRFGYITPPVSFDMALAIMRQFAKEHKDCKPKETPPPVGEGEAP